MWNFDPGKIGGTRRDSGLPKWASLFFRFQECVRAFCVFQGEAFIAPGSIKILIALSLAFNHTLVHYIFIT
jgi:hypothetical protein